MAQSKESNFRAIEYFVKQMREKKIVYKDGKLWKLWEAGRGWLKKPKRAERKSSSGYLLLRYEGEGGPFCVSAHRVIWVFFNGPIPPGIEVNHMDGRKDNNHLDNLELVTRSENIRHAARTGLYEPLKGTDHPLGKLSDDDVRKIRRMAERGVTYAQLAKIFKVGPDQISRIVRRERRYWVK